MEDHIHHQHQGTQEHPHEGEAQEVVRIHRHYTRHVHVRVHDARNRGQVHQGTRVQRLRTMEMHQGTTALNQGTMALHQETMVPRQGMTVESQRMTVESQRMMVEGTNVPILERRLVYIQTAWERLGKRTFAVDL